MAELRPRFHLFVYGTLRSDGGAAALLRDCELAGRGQVGGVLYDTENGYPALVLYGSTPVRGEVWLCPNHLLHELDEYERVADGCFRRVAVMAADGEGRRMACWTYVAGPALVQRLTPANRIERWP